MTGNIQDVFDEHEDEFTCFERVENKRSQRPDLHAFLLLDELLPGSGYMVCAGEHDEIFLDTSADKLFAIATEAQIIELIRCGIRYSDDCFCMFV